jgi:poly [ADP-ribose] polymerase 2/3/4
MCVSDTIKSAKGSPDEATVALIDKQFDGLNLSEMTPLENDSGEFKHLRDYLNDTAGASHGFTYNVQDIFRIERKGEKERFQKSKYANMKSSNKLLLWHGSRSTNFGGILSQGLRIAPPEAPVSGYAFGKGVYLADCSSKSAQYCCAYNSNFTGLLLLVEAELSDPMYEISSGEYNAGEEAKKRNCISTKGVGQTVPQAWKDAGCVHEDLKGVKMPKGQVGPNTELSKAGYLQYNEYIAYDVNQLRLRYLLKVRM